MTTKTLTAPAYRLLGTNGDTDTCEICGKVELRRVMALQPLDIDGAPDGDAIYAGTSCGARALTHTLGKRITATRIVAAADAVERLIVTAREWATIDANCTLNQYIAANHVALLNANNQDMTAALADAKTSHAAMLAEAAQILAAKTGADLIGTRFERMLPLA